MAIATGQISIVDYTDAPSVSAFITSSKAKTQTFDPNSSTYNPDWKTGNPTLTPSLFVSSDATNSDKITSAKTITWYDMDAPSTPLTSTGNYTIANVAGKGILTIKDNLLTGNVQSKTFICDIIYTDPTSGFDLRVKAEFTYSRVNFGTDSTYVSLWAPDGNIFKNNTGTNLRIEADVYKANVALANTASTYEWFVQSVGAADEGMGAGWKKITSANAASLGLATTTITTNTDIITIKPDAVLNVTTFKIKVTNGGKVYTDSCTFIDSTDPIQVTVISSNGDIFKNGVITTRLTAKLFQNGGEIDPIVAQTDPKVGFTQTYKWYRYDKNGVKSADFGGTGIDNKTGKWIDITAADVTQKATFIVEIS